jgi:alkanesulfonate monooxygenase SsuD/methylene tetrahydromethanopterin reductase-like flavin-dependent oxidoreductase (luciferase family)
VPPELAPRALLSYQAVGIEWPEFRERFARLREAVTLMRRLWSEDRVTYEGTCYKAYIATVYDKPCGGYSAVDWRRRTADG